MAEKDASLAMENACQQLEKEAYILEKVGNLKSLRSGLRNMSMLLKEFDGQEYGPEVARWLHRVRDIAYETQDKLDSIVVDTKLQKRKSKLSRQQTIKHQLEDIEKSIQQIPSFKDVAGSIQESDHDSHSMIIGDMVRFRESKDKLVTHLITGGSKPKVIFIFGKEGLGKTTLAKMVYNDARIKEYFSFREWVYLPRGLLSLGELLLRILKHISPSTQTDCKMNEVELMDELSKSFKGKKYLIVMDNLCNIEVCDAIMSSFPDDLNGSGILLTSREEPPAALCSMSNSLSHQVKPLEIIQSWELLSRKVFEGENCPSYLEDLGKRLADRCKGCPRAIIALAAILSHAEKTQEIWTKFLQDSNKDGQILNLASLPNELQLCLLYFGLFPIDFDIPAKQIIQMWVAEGLLKQKGSKRAEEIGEDHLKELIKRSFIHVGTKKWDGRPKTCAISSYVFHLCINEGEDDKFMMVKRNSTLQKDNKILEVNTERNSALDKDIKRLGIHNLSKEEVLKSFGDCSHPHTLHCFGEGTDSIIIHSATSNFSHLRVLNLGSMELDRVPKVVGELIQLKYLRLRAPNVTHLPSSVGNLHNLETLDMRESCIHGRLNGIWKMKLLRHLYLGGFTMPDPRGIDYYRTLHNLQTLSGVHPDKILKRLMVKAKFPNVTRLRICSSDQQSAFKFLNSLDHLSHLQSLRVEKPTKFPDDPNAFPLSLIKLTLLETRLPPGCINKLENLPNLKMLKLLKESITSQEIECTAGGFLQLQVLYLDILGLEKLTLGKGAMRCLKHLFIKEGLHLKIPHDLQKRTTIVSGERSGIQ